MRSLIVLIPALMPTLLIAACDRQAAPPPQPKPASTSEAKPTKAFFDESQRGTSAPATPFKTSDGRTVTFADFRGKPVLVNLWATWCGPCVKEMPALDALAARTEGRMTLLTINQMDEPAKLTAWWKDRKLQNLQPYAEPEGQLSSDFGSGMLPTTVLYDATGKEVWRVVGEMDWSGADATARFERL
jgi:thiol-disulfide isomerase/thioredoxin